MFDTVGLEGEEWGRNRLTELQCVLLSLLPPPTGSAGTLKLQLEYAWKFVNTSMDVLATFVLGLCAMYNRVDAYFLQGAESSRPT
jgi:hypothetical protein